MKVFSITNTASVITGFLLAFSPAGKEQELVFQLKADKVYAQRTSMVSTTKQVFAAQELTYGQNAAADTYMQLLEKEDSASTYSVWYGDIKLGFEQTGMTQQFGSDTTKLLAVDPMSRIFSSMVNQKFSARVSNKGLFEEIFGLEEMIASAVGDAQSSNSELADQISSGFGDGGIAKNLEVVTAIFPDEAVVKGDTWQKEQFSSSGLPLIIKSTFTLSSIKEDEATIKVEGIISMDPKHTGAVVGGLDVIYSLSGTRKGTIKVHPETGWVINGELNDDIDGKIIMKPNTQFPAGTEIPLEMDNTTTITNIPQ